MAGIAFANPWALCMAVSQLVKDWSIYKGQLFYSKREVLLALKTFSVVSHQQYYIYTSTKSLLKWKCKRETECAWSLSAVKENGRLWGIIKYKGSCTCMNPLMNKDYQQLDVPYISTFIRLLVKVESSISNPAIHATVAHIMAFYCYTCRKVR